MYSKYISNSFLLNLLAVFSSLIVYESVYYYIYILLGLNDFNLSILIKSLISTIPINVGYYILSYLCLNKVKAVIDGGETAFSSQKMGLLKLHL